uniref:Uncharacterized protein n=1 Tax=Meloidogyne enterolobii TaxID=390850 RepID=A0A6V7TWM0_MELEN|nr:unnamed protein product [Meloidogyne enterolobii]
MLHASERNFEKYSHNGSTQERLTTRIAPIIFVNRFIEKFNCNWACHIRLYGNFWMNYKKL